MMLRFTVGLWPLADITTVLIDVRFGGKAEIAQSSENVQF